jgi:hypothetical protein
MFGWPATRPAADDKLSPRKDGNMKMLITGSVAALAIALITGPVLIQPAFAEEPDSVNVGGKSIGADPDAIVRFQMRRDFDERNFCRGAGDLFLFGHVDAYPPGSFRLHRAVPGR